MEIDPHRIYVSESHEPAVVHVAVWPPDDLARTPELLEAIRSEAVRRMAPGMSYGLGPALVPSGIRAEIATFSFTAEHLPLPYEEVLAWLRGQPWVRIIEITRSDSRSEPSNER